MSGYYSVVPADDRDQDDQAAYPVVAGLRVRRLAGSENHLISYRPVDDGIEVVRIIHAARDIGSVLDA